MSTNSHIGEQHTNLGNDEISLKELILKIQEWWRYLWSKKTIIIGFGLLGGILGFVYANFQQPTYTATTTFVLESGDAGGGLAQYAGLASMAGIDLGGGGGGGIFNGDNILELYKSRKMVERALLSEVLIDGKKQSLMERYLEINDLKKTWDNNPLISKLKFDSTDLKNNRHLLRLRDSILSRTVENITSNYLSVSKLDKKLNIIKVDVTSADEIFAKLFNDCIVNTVNNFYFQTKTKKSAENVAILQAKVDSVRMVLSGSIYRIITINDATPNLNLTRQVQRMAPQQKAQFSAETSKAILNTLVQNLELSKIVMRKEAPLIQKIDEPIYPLKINKLSKSYSLIFGGVILGIIVSIIILIRKVLSDILNR